MANSFALRQKVRYNSEDFPRYFRQLRGLCLKSKGAWILNKLVTNPVDKFLRSIKELHTVNAESGTDTEGKNPTPQKQSHRSTFSFGVGFPNGLCAYAYAHMKCTGMKFHCIPSRITSTLTIRIVSIHYKLWY